MKNSTQKIVITKTGNISKNIINAINHCTFTNDRVYTGYYSGSGRFTTANTALPVIKSILEAQGYKFEIGNDAPRGGVNGEHLKISKTAITFLQSLKK